MKESVIKKLMKDGYNKDIAAALTDKYWESAERNGCKTAGSIYKFIINAWGKGDD